MPSALSPYPLWLKCLPLATNMQSFVMKSLGGTHHDLWDNQQASASLQHSEYSTHAEQWDAVGCRDYAGIKHVSSPWETCDEADVIDR